MGLRSILKINKVFFYKIFFRLFLIINALKQILILLAFLIKKSIKY